MRDDNRDGEKRHRLAVRGAWFLGKTREERRTYFDTLRFVYDYASAVIHGGTPKAKEGRDITKDIALAQDLCRNAILLMAQAEKRPDWSDVILGLVPGIPSPPDLWAGVAIRKVIEAASSVNKQLQARLLINQRKPNTRLAAKTFELLPEYHIPICRTQIGDREAYRHAAAYGQTVHDLGSKAAPAVREVEALTSEILSVMQPGESVNEKRPVGRPRPVAAG